jgi:broad specificity polyphosphatase/5'/3'-nucleotidase SurE
MNRLYDFNKKIDLLDAPNAIQTKMDYEFCKITVPFYMSTSANDCPITYFLRKYNFNINVPRPFKCEKTAYIVCLPSKIYNQFMRALEDHEDCDYSWLKTQKISTSQVENSQITMENNDYTLRN